MESEMYMISDYLITMFVENQKLTHIDLSCTGLDQQIIKDILPSAKESSSLVAIHLSNNPGITE